MSEEQLRKNVYAALKTFQDSLRNYKRETGSPPDFLVNGASPVIPQELLAGCRVFSRRNDIIADLPKGGIGVEVGTQTGRFARTLMDLAKPRKLYLLDIDYTPFRREYVEKELAAGTVVTREGSSWDLLEEFEDEYFDFAYIDAGHGYEMVKKDLAASLKKVKKGGHILCNDYLIWSAFEGVPYGVHKAVSETITDNNLQVTHFAFHPYGYNDIAFING